MRVHFGASLLRLEPNCYILCCSHLGSLGRGGGGGVCELLRVTLPHHGQMSVPTLKYRGLCGEEEDG